PDDDDAQAGDADDDQPCGEHGPTLSRELVHEQRILREGTRPGGVSGRNPIACGRVTWTDLPLPAGAGPASPHKRSGASAYRRSSVTVCAYSAGLCVLGEGRTRGGGTGRVSAGCASW